MSHFKRDKTIADSDNDSVILYNRNGIYSDIYNTNNINDTGDINEAEKTNTKETVASGYITNGDDGINLKHRTSFIEDTNASFITCGDKISCIGLSTNKPADLNFLAVHSNEHIEREREKFWKTFQNNFASSTVPICTGPSNYSRPRLPYLQWNLTYFAPKFEKKAVLSMFDRTYNAFEKREFVSDNRTSLLCIPNSMRIYKQLSWTRSSVELAKFVQGIRDEVDNVQSLESKKIMSDIENILYTVLKAWEQKYIMFKNFNLLKMGSTYEGTKIGKPDEFDYMIELPSLCGVLIFEDKQIIPEPELKNIKVIDRNIFTDVYATKDENEDDKTFMKNVWNQVLSNLCDTLQENLPPGWKWLNTQTYFLDKLALTQQLLWSGVQFSSLVVDVDICLAVPNRQGNFNTGIDMNQEILDERRPGITDRTKRNDKESDEIHIVLRSDGLARVTMAVREMMIWKIVASNNKRSLYRCLKHMVSKYLPKTWNDELYRQESVIPSYWLKTILFYLFAHYTDEEHWSISNTPLRVVEVFFILDECLHANNLSSFFVPHNILKRLLDEKETYSKIKEGLEELNDALCKLQQGENKGLSSLQVKEAHVAEQNKETLEKSLYRSVVELLYFYGYNEYSSENMTALKSFLSVFLKDRVKIEGEGKSVKVWYDGNLMDIDSEIYLIYKDTEKYFCSYNNV